MYIYIYIYIHTHVYVYAYCVYVVPAWKSAIAGRRDVRGACEKGGGILKPLGLRWSAAGAYDTIYCTLLSYTMI